MKFHSSRFDRTSGMGLFPFDDHSVESIEKRAANVLADITRDTSLGYIERENAMWNLVYRKQKNISGLLLYIALTDKLPEMRRSASWGLLKIGDIGSLQKCISEDDNGNIRSWKMHLINEANNSTEYFETRPVRLEKKAAFDFTMPLYVEGIVQFKDNNGLWRYMVVAAGGRHQLVGKMTAAINARTFDTELVIQKRIENLMGKGTDYVQGYLFKGLSRPSGVNSMTHYYESTWRHDYFKSGRTGDDSKGSFKVDTHLFRVAETDLAMVKGVSFPFPQSVRGVFYGPVKMNTAILRDKNIKLDGLLQIVSGNDKEHPGLANGWFYGSFRGVPEDLDNDGKVELNGEEIFVDVNGNTLIERPKSKNKKQ